jgi:hypothetical protein
VLDGRLAAGELDLAGALEELESRVVDIAPDELINVNTERELERLRGLVST